MLLHKHILKHNEDLNTQKIKRLSGNAIHSKHILNGL